MVDKGAGLFMGALCLPHIKGDFSKANMYLCVCVCVCVWQVRCQKIICQDAITV